MTPDWTADRTVTIAQAASLIETQFPQLVPVHVEPLAAGWDNSVFLCNQAWVFRFPRREIAVGLLRAECAVLPVIAPLLPLPVPQPTLLGVGVGAYPWPFAGYRMLPGRAMWRSGHDDAARSRAAAPLGAFLSTLHAIDVDVVADAGLGHDSIGRLDLDRRRSRITDDLDFLSSAGVLADPRPWLEIAESMPDDWSASRSTLTHGDLHGGNLLVDEHGDVCAVVDWGDVHLGDPAVDLAVAHMVIPTSAHTVFRETYGTITESAWQVARIKALDKALVLLRWGLANADDGVMNEAARTLDSLIS